MNQLEKQRAFDYSMYVMLSSYFDNTICTTNLQKQKLCLAYQELKEEVKQIYDELSIRTIEKELLPNLPKQLLHQDMKMALVGKENNMCTEIRLQNAKYLIRIKCRYDKKKPILLYEIWHKETATLSGCCPFYILKS